MSAQVGHVRLELMMRVADEAAEPRSLGVVNLPLTLTSVSTGILQLSVGDVTEYVRAALAHTFDAELAAADYVDLLFDGPPGPEGQAFVEAVDPHGNGVSVGEWIKMDDDPYWRLRVRGARTDEKKGSET